MKLKLGIAILIVLVIAFVLFAFFIETDGFNNDYEEQTTAEEISTDTGINIEDPASHPYGSWYIYRDETTGDAGLGRRDCTLDGCDCYDMRTVSKGLAYSVNSDGKTCTITGIGECSDSVFIIPYVIDGYEVVKIHNEAFMNCSYMSGLAIPSTVVEIGQNAFFGCRMLSGLYIPDGVVSIGDGAFAECNSIASVSIPDSVTHIGDMAFANCYKLNTIDVSKSNAVYKSVDGSLYTKDGAALMQYALGKKDKQFTTPDGVKEISSRAFSCSANLTKITLSEGITYVGDFAFSGCGTLEVIFPESLESIGELIFESTDLKFNEYDNAYYIGSQSNPYFMLICGKSADISSCAINEKTKFIYDFAFFNYTNLKSVIIPDSVTGIGKSVFYACEGMTSATIGNGLEKIPYGTFEGCISLTDLSIGSSVSFIDDLAFKGCQSLDEISLPSSVRIIGERAFEGCEALTTVTIPMGVEIIKNSAFSDCSALKNMSLSASVTSIGLGITSGCSNLESIYVSPENTAYVSMDGNLYSVSDSALMIYVCKKNEEEFSIPDGVKKIAPKAFDNWISLKKLNIPASVIDIDSSSFTRFNILKEITVDNNNPMYKAIDGNLYSRDGSVFIHYCRANERSEFELPSDVTEIADYAFLTCNLKSIKLPASLEKIGNYAFQSATRLEEIHFGNHLKSIGNNAFFGCSSLNYISFGNGIESIGSSAFNGCTSLDVLRISDSVKSIGSSAFWNCTSLREVLIGNGVQSIESYAFGNCTKLEKIYYNSSKSEWDKISVNSYNSFPENATIYYYSESKPADAGNYWYYIDDVIAIWI